MNSLKIRQLEVSKQYAFLWEYICSFQIVLTAQVQKGYSMLGHPWCFHTCQLSSYQLSSCKQIKTKLFFSNMLTHATIIG